MNNDDKIVREMASRLIQVRGNLSAKLHEYLDPFLYLQISEIQYVRHTYDGHSTGQFTLMLFR